MLNVLRAVSILLLTGGILGGAAAPAFASTVGHDSASVDLGSCTPAGAEFTSGFLSATVATGVPFRHDFDAVGCPEPEYGISSPPPGVTFDVTTGELTGVPTKAGVYVFTVIATNPVGTSFQTARLTVEPGLIPLPPRF